jgi:hypothetical protein
MIDWVSFLCGGGAGILACVVAQGLGELANGWLRRRRNTPHVREQSNTHLD